MIVQAQAAAVQAQAAAHPPLRGNMHKARQSRASALLPRRRARLVRRPSCRLLHGRTWAGCSKGNVALFPGTCPHVARRQSRRAGAQLISPPTDFDLYWLQKFGGARRLLDANGIARRYLPAGNNHRHDGTFHKGEPFAPHRDGCL